MVKVVKADGLSEEYSEQKIVESARRVGVPSNLLDPMLSEIRSKLFDGIHTYDIFHIIQKYLETHNATYLSAKYNLKEALSQLGPSGYPFEKFVAELLTAEGYVCQTNVVIDGKCVKHEVDVLAQKDGITYFIEAKFHKNVNQRSDVRVALYIYGRYIDIMEGHEGKGPTKPWIVTNTRFSTDALTFANCRNIRVTSWGYPKGDGIMDLIERTGLHPITMLPVLTDEDKRRLLAMGCVTVQQLIKGSNLSDLVPPERLAAAVELAGKICQK